ncbi:methyltransferase domain-containing protein [Dendrothele bispora CBS 962.96]|uniref:Alpha N-terminal protein methyltransferase 1 n=1 Tax=Dendrothele bispora (strain CBS 962.96) TaxID=1314807 RepID=A0A4S8LK24_DENBC|nr:methyltransferase domain-containing protein [Dendrothele bispora CBS 962.96]
MSSHRPVVSDGISYWNQQQANIDGVLGGFGTGTLPRVDATGSRLFLLNLYPELCKVPSAIRPLNPSPPNRLYRALDVGAGVGRVTSDVLLPLVDHVLLLEPVTPFIQEALASAANWPTLTSKQKSVTFIQGILQAFDPCTPLCPLSNVPDSEMKFLARIGSPDEQLSDIDSGFDVIWCQWCLGHLDDPDLTSFFQRSRNALRNIERGKSLIIVKENCCADAEDGGPRIIFDKDDSTYTRSDMAWKAAFKKAGLRLIREQVQEGLPEGLYPVRMYALK